MKRIFFLILLITVYGSGQAQKPYSVQMADSFMSWHKDSIAVKPGKPAEWDYEQGLMLQALEKVWYRTADPVYFEYVVKDLDRYIAKDGSIRTYRYEDFNLDNIPTGKALLMLYQQTQPDKEKYRKAADHLWEQLENQPKTKEKGYWHKQRYPNQMWLDGLFMAEPFSAEYSLLFKKPEHFDDIARQFDLIEKYAVDEKTGLIYHAYDESRAMEWADKKTGRSPHFWSRAIGWYAMALVDVLDYFPENHPARPRLVSYLRRLAPVIVRYQDAPSGVWYQITDLATRKGNYLEASASCMFVYALAKGVRMGYLASSFLTAARKGYSGILKEFVEKEKDGSISLNKTVSVGGLGGVPYRDGSFEYYMSEPIRKNDLKGVGPFIFASIEIEIAAEKDKTKPLTVGLDYYFNREFRKDHNGDTEQFHYTWEDKTHSGFWLWGKMFRDFGYKTVSIPEAPSARNLAGVHTYIIVDPDTRKETAAPNFVSDIDIAVIKDWVGKGGTLILMANDTANCEIPRFNRLSTAFGISFTNKSTNMVEGVKFEQGRINIPPGNPLFKTTSTIYIKELVTLALKAPAVPVLKKGEDIIIATSTFGKGRVFVVGDPWLYNEYLDGRRIGASFENYNAARDIILWTLRK